MSNPSLHEEYIISLWLRKTFNFLRKINLFLTSFSKLSNNSKERKLFSKNYLKKKKLLLSNSYMMSSITPKELKYYFKEFLKNPLSKHSDLYIPRYISFSYMLITSLKLYYNTNFIFIIL